MTLNIKSFFEIFMAKIYVVQSYTKLIKGGSESGVNTASINTYRMTPGIKTRSFNIQYYHKI